MGFRLPNGFRLPMLWQDYRLRLGCANCCKEYAGDNGIFVIHRQSEKLKTHSE